MRLTQHPPTRACEADHCHFHNVDEPRTGVGTGHLCRECGHWFPTDADLIEATHAKRAEVGLPALPAIRAEEVYTCPHCSHDF